jgi:RNA polymerase sigma factor (sigma-70 family)
VSAGELTDELGEFQALMQRVREGSDDACRELLARYGPHVVRAVRRYLSQEMRPKFDSIDFTQSVWASFFANRGRIGDLGDPDALIGFLAAVARNKVVAEYRRRHQTQKNNVQREWSLELLGPEISEQVNCPMPTPSQTAIGNECWDRLIQDQPRLFQEVLRLRRCGMTHDEVAEHLGIDPRTVRRAIQRVFEERG